VAYSASTDKNKYHTKYFNILNQRTSLAVHIKDVSNIFDVQAGIANKRKTAGRFFEESEETVIN
jgi:hypothetical protein